MLVAQEGGIDGYDTHLTKPLLYPACGTAWGEGQNRPHNQQRDRPGERPLSRKRAPPRPAVHFSLRPHGGRRERGGRGTVRPPPLPRTVGSSGRRKALWGGCVFSLCSHVARGVAAREAGAWRAVMVRDRRGPRQRGVSLPLPEGGETRGLGGRVMAQDPPGPA